MPSRFSCWTIWGDGWNRPVRGQSVAMRRVEAMAVRKVEAMAGASQERGPAPEPELQLEPRWRQEREADLGSTETGTRRVPATKFPSSHGPPSTDHHTRHRAEGRPTPLRSTTHITRCPADYSTTCHQITSRPTRYRVMSPHPTQSQIMARRTFHQITRLALTQRQRRVELSMHRRSLRTPNPSMDRGSRLV